MDDTAISALNKDNRGEKQGVSRGAHGGHREILIMFDIECEKLTC